MSSSSSSTPYAQSGQSITNYSLDKPSYQYTTSTTEFDDELMKREIVTFEQCMMAKGATPEEARRLALLKQKEEQGEDLVEQHNQEELDPKKREDEDEDEFIANYRKKRLRELKQQRDGRFGEELFISRNDWSREVNEASCIRHNGNDGTWVIINLTTESQSTTSIQHDTTCRAVRQSIQSLATKYTDIKFVSIPFNSAIENWPVENLPTIFCYYGGKLRCQLVGVDEFGGHGVNVGRVEWRLKELGVFDGYEELFDLEFDPEPDVIDRVSENRVGRGGYSNNKGGFGGVSAELATAQNCNSEDDESDYDDVD
mmetsp:Transcript_8745/g.12717  ORF Transcript_8745/g.12717 Transcript_8745/m.12717 type:complete len:313 (-) Transcript_8745:189-1127(-)